MPPTRRDPSKGLCQVCKLKEQKYKCPGCHAPYCSVACFKLHKETCGHPPSTSGPSSTATPNPTDLPPASTTALPPLFPLALPSSYRKEIAPSAPLRSLASLKWPEEPDSSIFNDPLTRDDPKPLRREELMRIGASTFYQNLEKLHDTDNEILLKATSPTLRSILANNPALKPLLATLYSISDPKHRAEALSRTLGIDEASLSGTSKLGRREDGFYLTPQGTSGVATGGGRGRGGGRGKRGNRGGGGIVQPHRGFFVGDDEKNALKEFAEAVRIAIEGEGEDGGKKAEWEV